MPQRYALRLRCAPQPGARLCLAAHVAALIPLAPTFQAAGQLAEHVSERAAARPAAVFPMRADPDWGEADARFGAYRGGHVHEGQDVFAPAGTPLVAIRDGRVVETGDDGGRGNYVAIWSAEAGPRSCTCTCCGRRRSSPATRVRMGERVGAVGCTGSCWGDHLHFEIRARARHHGRAARPAAAAARLAARRARRSSLRAVDQMELRNRLVMATQMWKEATAEPLPRMAPGEPAEQLAAFELKLVDMLCAQATRGDGPRRRRQDLGPRPRPAGRGPGEAARRGVPRGARPALGHEAAERGF